MGNGNTSQLGAEIDPSGAVDAPRRRLIAGAAGAAFSAPIVRSRGLVPGLGAAATAVPTTGECQQPGGSGSRTFTADFEFGVLGFPFTVPYRWDWFSSFNPVTAGTSNCVDLIPAIEQVDFGFPVNVMADITITTTFQMPSGMSVTSLAPHSGAVVPVSVTQTASTFELSHSATDLAVVGGLIAPPTLQGVRICGVQTGSFALPLPQLTVQAASPAFVEVFSDELQIAGSDIVGPSVC